MDSRRTLPTALACSLLTMVCLDGSAAPPATQPANRTERTPTTVAATTQPAAPEIPLIGDLGTLRQKSAIKLRRDWQARVGLGSSGQQGGPWMVLYCLASYAGDARRPTQLHQAEVRRGEPLGPLSYSIQRIDPPHRRLVQPPPLREHFSLQEAHKHPPTQRLYAAVIPLTHKGRWLVRVYGPKGEVVARRVLTVRAPLSTPWAPLLENTGRKAPIKQLRKEGTPQPVARDVHAVLPRLQGRTPLWAASGKGEPSKRGRFLPGTLPPVGGWARLLNLQAGKRKVGQAEPPPLTLKADKGVLLVESRDVPIADGRKHLLARWWINDKPLYPPILDVTRGIRESGLVAARGMRELKIACQWPDFVKPVRPGDRIGVQLLYCPDGSDLVTGPDTCGKAALALHLRDRHPLLSNRADFRVTAEMVRNRAATALKVGAAGEGGSTSAR